MNFLNIIFINFITVMIINGILINMFNILPDFISQLFRYGKFSDNKIPSKLIQILEIPKSSFKHFYAFALIWSFFGLYIILNVIIFSTPAKEGVLSFFDIIAGGKHREVFIDSTSGLMAMLLLNMQCLRRFYETWFLQIFSNSKINILHYLVGYIHYFAAVSTILANTEGFVRGSSPSEFSLSKISVQQYFCAALYVVAWYKQYQSNIILVNLRKNKDGTINNLKHLLPSGSFFELISAPHMFFEIVLYLLLWGIIPSSKTWCYCLVWVMLNQTQNAWLTHKWYLRKFSKYPKQRRAIYPFIF